MSGEVRRSVAADRGPIAAMWAEAFAADPVIRWFLPDEPTYLEKATALFGFIFDVRHLGGEVWVRDNIAAAAWTPPGGLRAMEPSPGQLWQALTAVLASDEMERIDTYGHMLDGFLPEIDNWYLGVIGTAPGHQRKGHGSAVARPVLVRAYHEGTPQSLETCVPANRELYVAWGFEVIGEFAVDESIDVWVMARGLE